MLQKCPIVELKSKANIKSSLLQGLPVVSALEELQVCLVFLEVFGNGLHHLVVLGPLRERQDESGIVGDVFVHKVDLDTVEEVAEVFAASRQPVHVTTVRPRRPLGRGPLLKTETRDYED